MTRVLIADDEPEVREVFAEYLAAHGYEVLHATNGLEALLYIKRHRPEAVVLDLAMPRLGGLEALKRIRAFDPSIVVVVVTATLDEDVHRRALAAGARAVLTKAAPLEDLLAALRNRPALERTAAPPVAPEPTPAAAAPPTDAATILIVDDDPDVREMLEEFLAARGHHVRAVGDAEAALRTIVAEPPGVILLDITMPGLSGVEALPMIRAVAPSVAVIMISGTVDPSSPGVRWRGGVRLHHQADRRRVPGPQSGGRARTEGGALRLRGAGAKQPCDLFEIVDEALHLDAARFVVRRPEDR